MERLQSLEEFYRSKQIPVPEGMNRELGHFNVFNSSDYLGADTPLPYSRKDFYKVAFVSGRNRYFFADKTLDVDQYGLFFANPQVPYQCEHLDAAQAGFFCIFNDAFFHGHSSMKLTDFPLFRPGAIR